MSARETPDAVYAVNYLGAVSREDRREYNPIDYVFGFTANKA